MDSSMHSPSYSDDDPSYAPFPAVKTEAMEPAPMAVYATSTTVKRRRRLNRQEQAILEALFAESHNPSLERRQQVSNQIDMSMKKLQVWLQNRRQKEKKDAGKWKPAYSSTGATTISSSGPVPSSNNGRTSSVLGDSAGFVSSSSSASSPQPAPRIALQAVQPAAVESAVVAAPPQLPSLAAIDVDVKPQHLLRPQLPSLQRSLSLPSIMAAARIPPQNAPPPMQPRSASYSHPTFLAASRFQSNTIENGVKLLWDSMSSDPIEPEVRKHHESIINSPTGTETEADSQPSAVSVSSKSMLFPALPAAYTANTPNRRNSVRMEDILGSAGRASAPVGAAARQPVPDPVKKVESAASRKRTYSRTLSISQPGAGLQRSASTGSLSEAAARVFASLPSSPPVPASVHDGKQSSPILSSAWPAAVPARSLSSAGQSFQAMLSLPRPQLFRSRSFQDRTNTLARPQLPPGPVSGARRPALGTPAYAYAPSQQPQANVSASKRAKKAAHPNFAVFSDSSSDIEAETPELSFANSTMSALSSPETAKAPRGLSLPKHVPVPGDFNKLKTAVHVTTARHALAPLRQMQSHKEMQNEPQVKKGPVSEMERDAATVLAGLGVGA